MQAFPHLQRADAALRLSGDDVNDVMRFLADNSIRLMKLERQEPTLESLFMEVTGK